MRCAGLTLAIVGALGLLPGCGAGDGLAVLGIQIERRGFEETSPAPRAFDPLNPPVWVRVKVARASDVLSAVAAQESAWDDLPRDETTERRRLAIGVPPNRGAQDPYVLQLSSVVLDLDERRTVDECGVAGGIETSEGDRARVTVVTHPAECGILCAQDGDCPGTSRYCLAFECQEGRTCALDADCPAGARCGADQRCTAACGQGLPDCPAGFTCCGQVCAPSCGV